VDGDIVEDEEDEEQIADAEPTEENPYEDIKLEGMSS
jgi:hypothetical protein